MRKLIVLIMSSVLATGAVAQADQVNVTEDAGNLIFIDSIFDEPQNILFDASGEPTETVTDVTSLQPTKPGATIGTGRTEQYSIRGAVAQTQNSADIEQIAVCFYDSRVEGEVADLCGYGSAATNLSATMGDKGTNSPASALQAIVKTPSLDTSFYTDLSFENDNSANDHYVRIKPDSNAKQLSDVTYFDDGVAKNAVYFVVRVAPSHAMAFGTNAYKVRVAAIYSDNSVFTLTDTRTYSVAEYISLDTGRDNQVVYDDVIPGGDAVGVDDITTGDFYANRQVDVSIDATKFKINAGDDGIAFASSSTPGANQFALECILDSGTVGTDEFFVSETEHSLFSDIAGSNTTGDPEEPITLETHDCDLSAGESVPVGTYSNTVDVEIAAAS